MDDVLQAALDGVDKALVDFTYESASEASSLSDDEGADPEMEENFGPIVFGAPAVAFDEAGDSDIDSKCALFAHCLARCLALCSLPCSLPLLSYCLARRLLFRA